MSVSTADTQATFAATLVDEWVRAGVRHAVVCPGSRSTPLAVALAARDEIALHVRLDERGACFFAIGLAMECGVPTVVCTTSGTAAAELHAGVVEASHARIPLIVCTADRPARLHHVGAPQTIEQGNLYGSAVRSVVEPGPVRAEDRTWWRSLAARAIGDALGAAGPVHLNLAFDEPLLGRPGELPAGRADGGPWHVVGRAARGGDPDVGAHAWGRRGLIIAGGGAPPAELTLAAADHLGWPVLADPRSGIRVEHSAVVATADALLRDGELRATLAPEVILLLGQTWASRVVAEFVESVGRAGGEVLAVGDDLDDPARVVHTLHRVDGARFVDALLAVSVHREPAWRSRWERAETAAQGAIATALANDPLSAGGRLTEPALARHLFGVLDPSTTLFAAASMPMRDLEWFGAPRPNPPRVLANRGANGIDGVTSTALGVAASGGGPVVGLLGDLAFLHDASALATFVGEVGGSCTLVVPDNRGGGIFSFLPQASGLDAERFERLFGTEPAVSVAAVARGFGVALAEVSSVGELDDALGRFVGREGCSLIRVEVPSRAENRGLHDRIHASVSEAVRARGPG